MKGNVVVALIVGAALGFVVGKATNKAPEPSKPAAVAAAPTPAKPRPAAPGAGQTEDPNAVYRVPVGDSPVWGSADAKVTIVEGTDFECPFCSRANAVLKQIKDTYGPKAVRVSIKQNPLPFHQHGHISAQAALAAHEQGKYWQMHDKMFDNNKALDRASLEKYAQELGLDMSRFKAALDQQKFKDKIDAEQKLLQSVGAGGTPTFFINGRKVVGAQPFEVLKGVIDEETKKAEAMIARGVAPSAVYDQIMKTAATSPVMIAAPTPPPGPAAPPAPPAVQKVEIPAYSPFKGPKAAKVTVVEWSDFECPFCTRGAQVAHEIMKNYPDDVKFVFRHQPLPFHANAKAAARASMAAAKQGKFFEMHDKLFASQKELGANKYEEWAKELGLNVARFKADMESKEIAEQVEKDSADGNKVGANGTPTFFVNGRQIVGAQPFAQFQSLIDQEIKRADELMKGGVKLADVYEKITSMAPPAPPPPPEPPRVALQAGSAPLKGAKNAPVQIFVFSDFECPFCTRALEPMKQIEEAYGNKVALYFKQYPLPFHAKAGPAAEASLAAHEQGKFWPMHDKLFANQRALDRADLERYAKELGLDMAKFKSALDSGKYKDQVQKDMAQGSSAGVSWTPSFVINGKLVVGAQPFAEFKKVIDEELAKKK